MHIYIYNAYEYIFEIEHILTNEIYFRKLMSNILDMGIYISHENTLQILDAMFKAFKLTGK